MAQLNDNVKMISRFKRIGRHSGNAADVTNATSPVARSGHRMFCDGANLYSLGGYTVALEGQHNHSDLTSYPILKEIWIYNIPTNTWKRHPLDPAMPSTLASHSVVRLDHWVFVFGGTSVPFGTTSCNTLDVLDLRTMQWIKLDPGGDKPIEGFGHGSYISGDYLYIVGGTTGYVYNMDVHRFHLYKKHWEELKCSGREEVLPRYRHEIIIYNNLLFMFGGGQTNVVCQLEKLPTLDINTLVWTHTHTHPAHTHLGDVYPAPRRFHTCLLHKHNVYICGGYNGFDLFNDLWRLDMHSMRWSKFSTTLPQPLYFHGACMHEDTNTMYVFGGVCTTDQQRSNALYRVCVGPPPSLQWLTWNYITTTCIPHIATVPIQTLLDLGIPRGCLEEGLHGYRLGDDVAA